MRFPQGTARLTLRIDLGCTLRAQRQMAGGTQMRGQAQFVVDERRDGLRRQMLSGSELPGPCLLYTSDAADE